MRTFKKDGFLWIYLMPVTTTSGLSSTWTMSCKNTTAMILTLESTRNPTTEFVYENDRKEHG